MWCDSSPIRYHGMTVFHDFPWVSPLLILHGCTASLDVRCSWSFMNLQICDTLWYLGILWRHEAITSDVIQSCIYEFFFFVVVVVFFLFFFVFFCIDLFNIQDSKTFNINSLLSAGNGFYVN